MYRKSVTKVVIVYKFQILLFLLLLYSRQGYCVYGPGSPTTSSEDQAGLRSACLYPSSAGIQGAHPPPSGHTPILKRLKPKEYGRKGHLHWNGTVFLDHFSKYIFVNKNKSIS